ncbi:anthranilate phosphoribosyltransferase [Lacipirellula limnantheis]|uniref:Anthranilate phosphoribosyltransferase n=1 Tax=Lacipirellula limnantheis TaxID=2528024 RepID=A0A517U349_9BACT|nr:anthranilate phosphoribosyltransferase [Lacipirellula limnantheis]QDT75047.1 Anthranilate phosphoribosyltransferase [Lacipirellula limnantheis]
MSDTFTTLLGRLAAGEDLTAGEMTEAMGAIMSGDRPKGEIGLFLTSLAAKGETAEEVAGAARALRAHMTPIRSRYDRLLDTCGTGGGGSNLFNVSTTAALVIAATGVPVAKHGNRSITSRSGSADVLAELGVNIAATIPQVQRCLDELGICFCFAPLMHPAMKHVAEVRKELGMRTIFNVLGPLANPAHASHQLLGAGRPELRPLLASALRMLDVERALVVSGEDGLGEATLTGRTLATDVSRGEEHEVVYRPEDFGLAVQSLDAARVESPAESAAIVRGVLAGQAGAARDIVILNAACGLITVDQALEPTTAAKRAAEAIDSGAAGELLLKLAALSHG